MCFLSMLLPFFLLLKLLHNWINRSATKLLGRRGLCPSFVSQGCSQCECGLCSGFAVHTVAVKLWMNVITPRKAAEMQAADEPALFVAAATTRHCAHRAINTSGCQCCDTFKYNRGIISHSVTPFFLLSWFRAAGSLLKLLPTVMWESVWYPL